MSHYEVIRCPHCKKEVDVDKSNWDFIDMEEHIVKCPECNREFKVIVERPIEYYTSKE